MLKNWRFWTVVLEKTLESLLDCKEIKPINPKGNQSWIFIGRTDAEAEAAILWPHDAKDWLTGKDPDARKDWRQEKGTTEDEMVGWHHLLNGHEFEQAPGVGDGQGSLACCSPWVAELDTIEWMNWTELIINIGKFLSNSACLIYISLKSPIFLTLTISHLLTVHYYCFKTQFTVFKSSENDKSLFLSICVQIMVLFFSIC